MNIENCSALTLTESVIVKAALQAFALEGIVGLMDLVAEVRIIEPSSMRWEVLEVIRFNLEQNATLRTDFGLRRDELNVASLFIRRCMANRFSSESTR